MICPPLKLEVPKLLNREIKKSTNENKCRISVEVNEEIRKNNWIINAVMNCVIKHKLLIFLFINSSIHLFISTFLFNSI